MRAKTMLRSYSGELFKLRKRPAVWVVLGVWLVLMLIFTYVFPYLGYRSAKTPALGRGLLGELLPANIPGQGLTGYPVWGGALIVVLGALALGSEYGWGTMKTMLSNRPGRLTVFTAQVAALFTVLAALVMVAFACNGLASFLITNSAHANLASPSLGALVRSMLAGWLILCMWCLFGVTLAVLLRGTALSIGLGLVWVLAVENLIRATASLVPALGTFQKGLPGVNAGSLVAALGGKGAANSGTGIAPIVGGTQALLVVVFYFVLFGMVGALIVRRRDVQ